MARSVFDLDAPVISRAPMAVAAEAQQHNEGGTQARMEARRASTAAAEELREDTSAMDLVGAAQVDGGIGFFHRSALTSDVLERADPNYRLPDDFQDRMEEAGIGSGQWELFAKATSEEHFELLMRFARENQDVEETRSQFGLGANIAVGFTDPVGFALDAMTGGLARGATAGRLVNAARAGTVAGATGGAFTAAAGEYNPEVGVDDVLVATASSFVLGAALGARRGGEWVDQRVVDDIVKRDITGSQQSMGAARVDGLLEEPTPGLQRRDPKSAVEDLVAAGVEEAGIRPAFAKARLSLSARMGNSASPTARAISRRLFRDGVGVAGDRNAVIQESASEHAGRNRAVFETALHRGYNAAWLDERKAKGLSMWDRGAELEWNRQVADALRGVEVDSPTVKAAAARLRKVLDDAHAHGVKNGVLDPASHRADYFPQLQSRQAYQRIFGEMGISEDQAVDLYKQSILSRMRETADPDSLKKFEEIEESYKGASDAALRARERHTNIEADIGERQARLREIEADYQAAVAEGAAGRILRARKRRLDVATSKLQRAIDRRQVARERLHDALAKEDKVKFARNQAKAVADDAGVDEELAELYARAIINRGKRQVHGDQEGLVRPLTTDDVDALKEALEEAGASAEKIESILARYRASAEGGGISQNRKRIDLDPSFKGKFTNRFGKEVELSVTDFMENDAQRVVMAHVRDISGWSALASRANLRNQAEVAAAREQIRLEAIQGGENPDIATRAFDIGINSALGRSTETNPTSGLSRASRFLRDTQFIRVMNQVGFTQFTELGPVIAYGGLRNVIDSVFVVKDFIKRAGDGTLKSSEARYIEDLFATGTEHIRNPPFLRIEDDAFAAPVFGDNAFGRGAENVTQLAQRATSVLSGMAPINTMLQRVAGRASLMRLLQLANQKRPLSPGMTRRLRNWGLDDETRDAIFGALKGKHKVDDLVEADVPFEVRERMAAFLFRVSRHAVIEGDASDSVRLMHNAGGKIVAQFRSFMAYSYERHLLNGIHMRDWQAMNMVALSTTIAGLQWTARTYVNTIGAEEKRKELLTKGNVVKNAIAQSSWGGVVPAITDTILPLMGQDPAFANSRSTGLSNNLLTGNPSVDFLSKGVEAMSLPAQALSPDKDVTRKELEKAAKLLWFQNLTGWQNAQRAMFDSAEERGWISNDAPNEKRARAEDKKATENSWSSSYLFDLNENE